MVVNTEFFTIFDLFVPLWLVEWFDRCGEFEVFRLFKMLSGLMTSLGWTSGDRNFDLANLNVFMMSFEVGRERRRTF